MKRAIIPGMLVTLAVCVGWPASAGTLTLIEQSGTVSATADGNTVTDTLPQFQSGNVSVTAGTPQPGMDYATATAQSSFNPNEIHLILTANVGEWGNEGAAEARIEVVFSINQGAEFVVEIERTEATGSGWLGDRAFITLSNGDGIIFNRNVGGGYDSCNYDHPDALTTCENGILKPGTYHFEMIASGYAPAECGSCKGFAVASEAELKVTLP